LWSARAHAPYGRWSDATCVVDLAIARAALAGKRFDAVVLDWMLQGETSDALLPMLSAMQPAIGTIMYSASSKAKSVDSWSSAFLRKPFDITALAILLDRVVELRSTSKPGAAQRTLQCRHPTVPGGYTPTARARMTDAPKQSMPSRPRGFAAMTPEERRAHGSKGGKTAHERGTANRFTSDTASEARKIPHERGTAYRWTSEQARDAGRKSKGIPRPHRKTVPS